MDSTHFDDVTRRLARSTDSRRATLRLLGGALVGAALLSGGAAEAGAARCRMPGKRCRKNTNCCSGTKCRKKRCACTGGRLACDGLCVDAKRDNVNCGACGNACPAGSSCQNGSCRCGDGRQTCGDTCCANDQTCCGGICRNLTDDAEACGACDTPCDGNRACQNGGCCIAIGESGCEDRSECCDVPGANVICVRGFCGVLSDPERPRPGR